MDKETVYLELSFGFKHILPLYFSSHNCYMGNYGYNHWVAKLQENFKVVRQWCYTAALLSETLWVRKTARTIVLKAVNETGWGMMVHSNCQQTLNHLGKIPLDTLVGDYLHWVNWGRMGCPPSVVSFLDQDPELYQRRRKRDCVAKCIHCSVLPNCQCDVRSFLRLWPL